MYVLFQVEKGMKKIAIIKAIEEKFGKVVELEEIEKRNPRVLIANIQFKSEKEVNEFLNWRDNNTKFKRVYNKLYISMYVKDMEMLNKEQHVLMGMGANGFSIKIVNTHYRNNKPYEWLVYLDLGKIKDINSVKDIKEYLKKKKQYSCVVIG